MKIYSQTIDLSTVIPQTFFVSPNSQFKMGVKLVQDNEFVVKSGDVELTPDETTIDGFTTYTLASSKPGRKTYVVECDNGQKIEITQVTTKSTVFEVGGEGGSTPIGDVVTKVNGESPVEGNVDVDKLKIEGGFVTGDVLMNSISDVEDELDGKANVEDVPTKTSDLENDSGFITQDEVDANKITSADGNQYINGEGEVYVKDEGKDYTPWVAKYVDSGTEIDEMTFVHMGDDDDGYWLGSYGTQPMVTSPSNIPGNAYALELNFQWNDDGQWFDIKATREEIEREWTKKGDLALEGDISGIDAKATNALTIANGLNEDIWGSDGLSVKVEGLEQTKANVTETNIMRDDLNQAFDYIYALQQDKITSPETQMGVGKVLTVVEVEDAPVARGALQSVSPMATSTHLEWHAVDPDVTMEAVDTKIENIPTTTMSGVYEDGSEFSFTVLIKE